MKELLHRWYHFQKQNKKNIIINNMEKILRCEYLVRKSKLENGYVIIFLNISYRKRF